MFDYLIVGAGLYGAVFARLAMDRGKTCLVIDRRPHTGGNTYCEKTEGINVHKYGAHIFHTSDKKVWDFVNSYVPFNNYVNSPVANYKGEIYNLPFNMNTFARMWGVSKPDEAREIIASQRSGAPENPTNLEEQAISLVGKDIYEKLIKGYTRKQWGRPCTELPPSIIKRLPVRFYYDNNYFSDKYQGIPVGGYNALTDALLKGADVRLGVDFFDDPDFWRAQASRLVFSGKIDEYYGFRFGTLEYRTVSFETTVLPVADYQGNAVINYTDEETPYTRIIEHKHFEMLGNDKYSIPVTVISKEFSTEWKEGMEAYYPINDARNSELYSQYAALAQSDDVIFGGRLAEYKYYDMWQVVLRAMEDVEKFVK